MIEYLVNPALLEELEKFPAIRDRLASELEGESRSKRDIVRLLGNVTDPYGHRDLLNFINRHLPSAGGIGENILNATDSFIFSQHLAELYLLASLQSREGVSATAAVTKRNGKNYDIDLDVEGIQARIEIYSPVDHYGYQFIKRYTDPVFRYAAYSRGYVVEVELIVSTGSGYYAYQITNENKLLVRWREQLISAVKPWLSTATEGDVQEFDGVGNSFELKATLNVVDNNPRTRDVVFHEPTRSNDVRLFFEISPQHTVCNQMGRKITSKLEKRQCGLPDSDYLRIFILNFQLADDSFRDWFCRPQIAKNIDGAVKGVAAMLGEPLPFDVVIPARLCYTCCFGEAVILDAAREKQIRQLLVQTGFDEMCKPIPLSTFDPETEATLKGALSRL